MIRYAVRAVSWPEQAGGAAVLLVAVTVLGHWPSMWRSLGLSVALLVALGAWAMDEPAAAIVDTTPRSLRWRTTARLLALVPVALVWAAFAGYVGSRPLPVPGSGHTSALVLLGAGGLLLGGSIATLRRSRGDAVPGNQTALVASLLLAALGAFPRHLPMNPSLFPMHGADEWSSAGKLWTALSVAAVLLLLGATSHRRLPFPG